MGVDAPKEFSHLTPAGEVKMVDVSSKPETVRVARAEVIVDMLPETKRALFSGELPKGDVAATVRIAAIMATKKTPELVPLCHPLPISGVGVLLEETEDGARIEVEVSTTSRTGVEMESLTGVLVGALALYDMIKGIDRSAVIGPAKLLSKSGGGSGDWRRSHFPG